jgi:DNA-binding response OmpR family regulator
MDERELADSAARALAEAFAESRPLNPPASPEAVRTAPKAAARVLTPIVTEQLRVLIGRISELLGLPPGPGLQPAAGVLRRPELTIDVRTRMVVRGGRAVGLSRREFDLLCVLIRRRGVVASRTELLHEVWGPSARVRSRVVDTVIARLRRKLEDVPSEPRYILTAVALGYRFAPASIGGSP